MNCRYRLLFFLLSLPLILIAQINETSMSYEGLNKNSASYLSSHIANYENTKVDQEQILLDVQRLKNIPGIGFADYRIDTINSKLFLVFEIREVITLLPILNFGGIKDNYWYQFGLSDFNFRGRSEYISAHYQNNNGWHAGQFYYRNPYFKKSSWGYSLSLSRWASEEPLFFNEGTVNYEYYNSSVGLTLIKHFDIYRNLEFGATYFVEEYGKSKNQFLENPPGPDQLEDPKFLSKVEYLNNHIDYHFFLLSGRSTEFTYQNVYNLRDKSLFNSIAFVGKQYYKFGKIGNVAMRLKLAFSTNNFSPFAPFVVDSYVNLRGVGNRIDRGTGQAFLNLEYRQTIFEAYPFGAQFVVFSDLGSWRDPGG